jgi:hypothetical protein
MKNILIILLILTSFILSCNRYDYFDICEEINNKYIRIPLFFDEVNYFMVTTNYSSLELDKDLVKTTLVKYNTLNDSVSIAKIEIKGVPLVFHKNDFGTILLITSKCVYSLDTNNNIHLEVEYNTQNNIEIIGKTIYDYKEDKIYIRPGIDNPNYDIYEINHNSFSSILLSNKLSEIKFTLVDFNYVKNNTDIDYIFTDGGSYSLVKNEKVINKKLSTQDKIYSISYNYRDSEIYLGTTNGNIYYDDLKLLRINELKNGIVFPKYDCSNDIVTDINNFNNIISINKNNASKNMQTVLVNSNNYTVRDFGNSYKSLVYNSLIPKKNGNLNEYFGEVTLDVNQNDVNIYLFVDGLLMKKYPFNFNTLIVNFSKKTIYISKNDDTEIRKSFNY